MYKLKMRFKQWKIYVNYILKIMRTRFLKQLTVKCRFECQDKNRCKLLAMCCLKLCNNYKHMQDAKCAQQTKKWAKENNKMIDTLQTAQAKYITSWLTIYNL